MFDDVKRSNLRVLLALTPTDDLAALLDCFAQELSTRLKLDAAHYVVKAVACLDADRLDVTALPATTEP